MLVHGVRLRFDTGLAIGVQARHERSLNKEPARQDRSQTLLHPSASLLPRAAKIVTDQLRSYPATKADIPELANVKHVFVKTAARLNNRAENSHQPTRELERRMRGSRDRKRTQALLRASARSGSSLPNCAPASWMESPRAATPASLSLSALGRDFSCLGPGPAHRASARVARARVPVLQQLDLRDCRQPLPARYLVLLVVAQFCRRGQYQRGGLALVILFDIVGSTGLGEQFAKALCDGCRGLGGHRRRHSVIGQEIRHAGFGRARHPRQQW